MTASRPLALRKARRNRAFAARARRSELHLEKMMVQDETEKINRMTRTAIPTEVVRRT